MNKDILVSAKKKILFLPHAMQQMSRADRMITTNDIKETVMYGEIIEEYLDDPRGSSYLILHWPSSRAIHVVCSPKEDYLAIITAYIPNRSQWDSTLTKRIEK